MINERIMPMPQRARELLVRKYWGGDDIHFLAHDKANEHCLIRPHLGRRRIGRQLSRTRPRRLRIFSLRNFPLHMDQIEELGLPAKDYAIAMADALAFLHWIAKVDANDVEFVLARCRSSPASRLPGIGSCEFASEAFGRHAMWLLDFDCCKMPTMNEAGICHAARCFWRNDPFYPRPGSRVLQDEQLWQAFKHRFLYTSNSILQEEEYSVRRLPGLLMERITERCSN